jgi:hypothetical protein
MNLFLLKIRPSPVKLRKRLDVLRCVAGPTSTQPGRQACKIDDELGDDQAVHSPAER